ncbi:hypothetical protein BT93_K0468 [Corymbia citriodora subsp. variegata]|nr:hypothetical protein BT93_K0468 [Corymbia citriodora subsp. variegata]
MGLHFYPAQPPSRSTRMMAPDSDFDSRPSGWTLAGYRHGSHPRTHSLLCLAFLSSALASESDHKIARPRSPASWLTRPLSPRRFPESWISFAALFLVPNLL